MEWAYHLLSSGVYALVNVAQDGTGFPGAGVCHRLNPLLLRVPLQSRSCRGSGVQGALGTERGGEVVMGATCLFRTFPSTASENAG